MTTYASALPGWKRYFPALFLPVIRQAGTVDCGPSCILMLCRFFQLDVDRTRIRREFRMGPNGVSLADLYRCLTRMGFTCAGFRDLSSQNLTEAGFPMLAMIRKNHFVVVYATNRAGVLVGDPGEGLVIIPWDEWRELTEDRVVGRPPVPPPVSGLLSVRRSRPDVFRTG
jgi:ABC-type bacteriocin/lantibiotic exporter with double-glycine peptidase domain